MNSTDFPQFPENFAFGTATASYQIEGGFDAGGRGPSVWDVFAATPGMTRNGDTGNIAADHYHRFAEDIALMKAAGHTHYRFSMAWPRIFPQGFGEAPNPAGLDFYDRLIDGLLEARIAPCVTLFHWDTPQTTEEAGGWMQRDTALHFADYADTVGKHFADRVAMWMPLNEPASVTMLGYVLGMHAPGRKLGPAGFATCHYQLLGHGLAVQALRSHGATSVGIANNHSPIWPLSEAAADQQAAHIYDAMLNGMFADPILLGRYPDEVLPLMPETVSEDLNIIAEPLDWYGVNYYHPISVGAPNPDAEPAIVDGHTIDPSPFFTLHPIEGYPKNDFGWPVIPDGFHELLVHLKTRYGEALPPIYITENGCSYQDGPDDTGRVPDTNRIAFYRDHLQALHRAMADGVDVRGYFAWSLMDNFEWAAGYDQRFGLVHIDYETLKRTPKDSFYWYADLIKAQTRS